MFPRKKPKGSKRHAEEIESPPDDNRQESHSRPSRGSRARARLTTTGTPGHQDRHSATGRGSGQPSQAASSEIGYGPNQTGIGDVARRRAELEGPMAASELFNYAYDQPQQALSSSTNDPYASVGYGQPSVSIPPFASTSLERTYRRDDSSHNLWIVGLYNKYLAQGLSPADAEYEALVEARAQQEVRPQYAQAPRREPQANLSELERQERHTQPEQDDRRARDAQRSNEQTNQTYLGNPRVAHREEKGGRKNASKKEREELEKQARTEQKKTLKEEREEVNRIKKQTKEEGKRIASQKKQRAKEEREQQQEKYKREKEAEKREASRGKPTREEMERDQQRRREAAAAQAEQVRIRAEAAQRESERTRKMYFGDKHGGRGKH